MAAEHRIQAVRTLGMAMARRFCSSAVTGTARKEEKKNLYRRLSGLKKDPNGSVEETMSGWLREGEVVTESQLTTIVRELRRYKNYNHALQVTDWMENKGMEITFGTHAVRIDLLAKVKGVDASERYFSSLPEPAKNQKTYGALFNVYCQEKMADKVISLHEKMKELNLASSTLVSNNLMTLHMKLGHPEKVPEHFEEMKAANISPDKVTYGLLMNSYASMKDIESVERVVEEMKGGQVAMDWSTYCNLAFYYNSAGLFEKADSALKSAERVMKRHDRDPYDHLLTLYAAAGNLAEVNRIWKLLKSSFKVITNMNYLSMFTALRKLGDTDGLKQCFQEWESVYVTYDIRLVNVVIDAYLTVDMVDEALALWEKAKEKGVRSDFKTLELFAEYFMERRDISSVLKFLELMAGLVKPKGFKANKERMTAFLKHLEEVKDVDAAEGLCRHMKKLECLNAEAYESLLRTYLAAGRKGSHLGERIKEDGIETSPETEKLLERVCAIVKI
ncbi:pentatricopeptide repeat-containing protein, mitochondrial-like [Iris pallida]|uniref:Pentatricopeptide repeat-containing protein, mitochondrial-like n=1 Tax=Iris pallida TaxID=29817 RepID=A0AAX6DRF9_IRIPA|nr:pentatricopeptide repeat-containing protein, mitochondrial-like [Iris pallida]